MSIQNSTSVISKFNPCYFKIQPLLFQSLSCDILKKGDQIDIIEFKASQTIKTQMFDGLAKFEEISQINNLNKSLVYGGNTSQKRSAGNLVSWMEFGV